MKRSTLISLISLVLLAAFFVPATTVVAEETDTDGSAPDRVIKFSEVRFADPGNWSCHRECATSEPTAEVTPTGGREESCLACTITGDGSGDIVVTKAEDGQQETITDASAAEICADVLTAKASAESLSATDSVAESVTGMNPPVNTSVIPGLIPPRVSSSRNPTDGGERPVDSGMPATPASGRR